MKTTTLHLVTAIRNDFTCVEAGVFDREMSAKFCHEKIGHYGHGISGDLTQYKVPFDTAKLTDVFLVYDGNTPPKDKLPVLQNVIPMSIEETYDKALEFLRQQEKNKVIDNGYIRKMRINQMMRFSEGASKEIKHSNPPNDKKNEVPKVEVKAEVAVPAPA